MKKIVPFTAFITLMLIVTIMVFSSTSCKKMSMDKAPNMSVAESAADWEYDSTVASKAMPASDMPQFARKSAEMDLYDAMPEESATPADVDKTEPDSTKPEDKGRERKIIYTANYTIHVDDFDVAADLTKAILHDFKGEIKEETNYRLIVRVPPENFDLFTHELEKIGKIIDKFKKAEDVSEQYYDLLLRLESKKATLKAFEKLMEKAQTVKDMLAIQKEVRNIIEEIERMEGKLKSYKYLISMSTITITFTSETSIDKPQHRYNTPFRWVNYMGLDNLIGDMIYED